MTLNDLVQGGVTQEHSKQWDSTCDGDVMSSTHDQTHRAGGWRETCVAPSRGTAKT